MIGFLVFSDWFNPGDAIVQRVDGRQPISAVTGEILAGLTGGRDAD